MYKFEISANSPQELEQKMNDFVLSRTVPNDDDVPVIPVVPLAPVQQIPQFVPTTQNASIAPEVQQRIDQAVISQQVEKIVAPTICGQFERDSKGLPWDERIHSSSRAKVKDGSWRLKKGVEDSAVVQVESELRQKIGQPVQSLKQMADSLQPMQVVPLPPAPTISVSIPTFEDRNKTTPFENVVPVTAVPAQPAPIYENVQVPQGTRPAHNLISFKNNLMILMATLINEGKISQQYIDQLKTYFNVKEIWNILGSETQCIELYNSFGELGFITKVD